MVALIEQRRAHYETLEPVFWKRAKRSIARTRRHYFVLMIMRRSTVLVAENEGKVVGFLIARPAKVPPVYDPGATILIDDFCVARPEDWALTGNALLARLREIGAASGWRQIVVVCGAADAAKTAFLNSTDLSLASTWWTAPL